jgi:phospholipase D1/2
MPTVSKTPRARSWSRPAWPRLIGVIAVFVLLFLSWRYTPLAEIVTVERTMAWARSIRDNAWAELALVAVYTPAAFLMFPRPLITLFSVIAFGPWRGFFLSIAGIVGSALATYLVGRSLPERTLHRIAGRNLERTSRNIRRRGLMSVFAVSVAPVAPFPVIGMIAGALHIKLWQYVLGTMLGMLPGTLATTVFARQFEAALEDPASINYWIVAAILMTLVALIVMVRRWMIDVRQDAA